MGRLPKTIARLAVLLVLVALCSGPKPGASLTAPAAPETMAAPGSGASPNILFVMTDDQGDADGSLERMPKLQAKLVSEGVSFENAYPTTNQCCPSRASILRGQHAHSHGVWDNEGSRGGFDNFRDSGLEGSTAATWLDEAGYRTAYVGKYLNGYGDPDTPRHVPPGWDAWYGRVGGNGGSTYDINVNGTIKTFERNTLHDTDYYAKTAERLVRDRSPEPWFLTVAPSAPHSPFHAAKRHRDMFRNAVLPSMPAFNEADFSDKPSFMRDKPRLGPDGVDRVRGDWRQRMRSLQSVDDLVGRLYGALRETGQLDNTYIVFTSDNGYALYRNRVNGKGPYYDGAAGVPLVVRGPDVAAGETRDELAANIDLPATFADWAGAGTPNFVEGRSLSPLLPSGGDGAPWRGYMLQEFQGDASEYATVRTAAGELYAERYSTGAREHYRADDPHQLENDYPDADPARISELADRLEALEACSGAGCREADGGP